MLRGAGAFFALGIAAVAVVSCGDSDDPTGSGGATSCDAPTDCEVRHAEAMVSAAAAFEPKAIAMGEALATACRDAAIHFGVDPNALASNLSLEERLGWCSLASTGLHASGAAITVDTLCAFDLAAQAACESTCEDISACTAELLNSPLQRCGDRVGDCNSQCAGNCWAEPGGAVDCTGTCYGTCNGTCDGVISSGPCSGTCAGLCDGACKYDASAMAECAGQCEGSCSVDFESPFCTDLPTGAGFGQCVQCESCRSVCPAMGAFGTACRAAVTVQGAPAADVAAIRAVLERFASTMGEAELIIDALAQLGATSCCACATSTTESLNASAALVAKVVEAAANLQL